MQQQIQNPMGQPPNHFGPIGSISPSRSISPNSFAAQMQNDPKFFLSNLNMNMYPFGGTSPRNGFDTQNGFPPTDPLLYTPLGNSGGGNKMQGQQGNMSNSGLSPIGTQGSSSQGNGLGGPNGLGSNNSGNNGSGGTNNSDSKLMDGLNTYYSNNPGSYHHLLVAN